MRCCGCEEKGEHEDGEGTPGGQYGARHGLKGGGWVGWDMRGEGGAADRCRGPLWQVWRVPFDVPAEIVRVENIVLVLLFFTGSKKVTEPLRRVFISAGAFCVRYSYPCYRCCARIYLVVEQYFSFRFRLAWAQPQVKVLGSCSQSKTRARATSYPISQTRCSLHFA